MLDSKAILNRYREAAQFSTTQGRHWRRRFRMQSAWLVAIVIIYVPAYAHLELWWLDYFLLTPALFLAVLLWREGDMIFRRSLEYRQECLDEAKEWSEYLEKRGEL